jgi:hypothetical protein
MSEVVGRELQPTATSSLQEMLDMGLNKFIDK